MKRMGPGLMFWTAIEIVCNAKEGDAIKMRDADRIRKFAYENYVKPAKERGLSGVTVNVREVHGRMGFTKNNYPNICGALCRPRLMAQYGVKKIHRKPPSDGPNVVITYEL